MRTTITINDNLLKQLKHYALESNETVSSLIEQALVQQLLEDAADLKDIEKRLQEPTITHEQLIKELKAERLL